MERLGHSSKAPHGSHKSPGYCIKLGLCLSSRTICRKMGESVLDSIERKLRTKEQVDLEFLTAYYHLNRLSKEMFQNPLDQRYFFSLSMELFARNHFQLRHYNALLLSTVSMFHAIKNTSHRKSILYLCQIACVDPLMISDVLHKHPHFPTYNHLSSKSGFLHNLF